MLRAGIGAVVLLVVGGGHEIARAQVPQQPVQRAWVETGQSPQSGLSKLAVGLAVSVPLLSQDIADKLPARYRQIGPPVPCYDWFPGVC